jgi:Salmonella virulence plasmid 65kDa B protein
MRDGETLKGVDGVPATRGGISAPVSSSPRSEAPPLLPTLSLPKGGGAVRGIGEKFSTNPATGTGSLSVPIATSAGRSGFQLGIELGYDSGHGNGPFGLGWKLSTASVTRKTDKGLPRYEAAADEAPDVFILSGGEDLVPVPFVLPDDTQRPQGGRDREWRELPDPTVPPSHRGTLHGGARTHEEAVLEARRRLFGDEHLDTLAARLNLAGTLKAQGARGGARTDEEVVLDPDPRI